MSHANLAADFGSTRTVTLATKTLALAPSCAQRAQLSIVGLGGASDLPLLTGGRARVAVSCTGVTTGPSLNLVGGL
jgi:hypothetical protein